MNIGAFTVMNSALNSSLNRSQNLMKRTALNGCKTGTHEKSALKRDNDDENYGSQSLRMGRKH